MKLVLRVVSSTKITTISIVNDFLVNQVFDGSLLAASLVALIAGLISFASPCVLPLLPGYLGYVSGALHLKGAFF